MKCNIKGKIIGMLALIVTIGTIGSYIGSSLNQEIIIGYEETDRLKGLTTSTYNNTKAIIEKHKYDFNANNFNQKMKEYGGYKNYLKSLGGVFEKYADFNGRVKTYSELEEVANYVYGIMALWGFDYSADGGARYYSYYADDRFYPSRKIYGKENYGQSGIDTVASGGGNGMTANCNLGVDWTLRKAGLMGQNEPMSYDFWFSSTYNKAMSETNAKRINNAKDLQPGDIVIVTTDGNGFHTTLVVARDDSKGTITLYDSGSAFLARNDLSGERYKSVRKIGDTPWPWAKSWYGIRIPFNLTNDTNGEWKKNDKGVWFKRADGSYPKNQWAKIIGEWYHFDKSGYVETGLKKIDDTWYYLSEDKANLGRMLKGWRKINNYWRYFASQQTSKYKYGEMYTGFNVINYKGSNNTYYFDDKGIIATGWKKINNIWYYFDGGGVMQTGWIDTKDNRSYYLSQDSATKGQMAKGWKQLEKSGKKYWFFFAEKTDQYSGFREGQMLTGRRLVSYKGKLNYYYFCETTGTPKGYIKGAMIANAEYKGMKYDASGAYVDEVAPKVEISYSTKEPTSKNVVVTIKANEPIQGLAEWKLSEDKLTLTKEYKENKAEKLTIKDLAGNSTIAKIEVNNIDNKGPEIKVSYNETELTNKGVIVTLRSNEKVKEINGWTIDQEGKVLKKEYKTNVKEEVEISDMLGNKTKVKIEINNIYETKLETTKYTVDEDMIVIKSIGETVKDFKENNTVTAQSIKILNTSGQEMKEGELIGTGCKIILDDTLTYRIVVQGDYDGDGISSVKEMAITQRALLHSIDLEDIHLRALDINESGRIEVSDLAIICRRVQGKI